MDASDKSDAQSAPDRETFSMLYVSSDTWPPFRVDVDVLFGKEMHNRGHRIDWILQSEAAQSRPEEVSWNGWRVLVGPTNLGQRLYHRLHKHFLGIANDFKTLKLAKENNYDFVQVKDKFIAALFAMYATRNTPTQFIYWLSYPFPEASLYAAENGSARYPILYRVRGWFFKMVIYRMIAKKASHIFVQSEQMKRDMIAEGVPSRLMTAVPMGFEPNESDSDRGATATVPGQMIYLGTLLQDRRLDFLIRVLAIVRESVPHATLLMVGPEEQDGDMDLLNNEAKRLDLTQAVTLTGRLERDEAFKLVADSQVCFSPFYPTPILNSTSPTKLIEYFSLRKAAVANDHPEQRETLEACGGGFCVPWNEAAFAEAAVELINNRDEARAMGDRGHDWAMQHRTYGVIANEVNDTYLQLLQSRELA